MHDEDIHKHLESMEHRIKEDLYRVVQNQIQHFQPSKETKKRLDALEGRWKMVWMFFAANIFTIVAAAAGGGMAYSSIKADIQSNNKAIENVISSGLIKQDAIILDNRINDLERRIEVCEESLK